MGVFVMISGAFMLSPQYAHPPEKIFKHNLPKLLALIVFWVIFYGIMDALDGDISAEEVLSAKYVRAEVVRKSTPQFSSHGWAASMRISA